jgi:ornithine cyclodeaminase
VLVWNRTPDKASVLVAEGVADRVVDDLAAAVAEADLVCTATMTRQPLIRGEWLRPGTHVDCVGAYLPDHREIDDEVVRRAEIFVDSRLAAVRESGDLVIPLTAGTITAEAVGADLYELCRACHPGRSGPEAITLFENGGGGHFDLMVARYLWDAYRAG